MTEYFRETVLLTGNANPPLAQLVAAELGMDFYEVASRFSDGEVDIEGIPDVRDKDVFIVHPTSPPEVNNHLMELFLIVDALGRTSRREVTAVIPYWGYSRQDKKDRPRRPIASSFIARTLEENNIDRVVTIDLHSEQQLGFLRGLEWSNLYATYVLIPEIKSRNIPNLLPAAPDEGAKKRARAYCKLLGLSEDPIIVSKLRDEDDRVKSLGMAGRAEDKNILLVDDMIGSGGTIINAVSELKSGGAENIFVAATHGLFTGPALELLSGAPIEEIFITDTVMP